MMLESCYLGQTVMSAKYSLQQHVYRQTPNISRTNRKNLNVCRVVLYLPFPKPLKAVVKSRMKMQ